MFEQETERICEFIKRKVSEAKADGVVVGLSGGVDSSLVLALCVKALGKDKVRGILMPTYFTPQQDTVDAKELSEYFGIEHKIIDITPIAESFFAVLGCESKLDDRMPKANIYSRIRMILLYYFANKNNLLVAGTSDKSEMMMGFYTKYGDGGVDFEPIGHLYKTEVREMLKELVPTELGTRIAAKPSSPQLYEGHKATDQLPCDYPLLDKILKTMEKSEHKRNIPEMLERN